MPSVPSAPMKSFVVSKPADDLRARLRVLMTSPEGSTTVCARVSGVSTDHDERPYRVQEPLRLCRSIPHRIGYVLISVRRLRRTTGTYFLNSRCSAYRPLSRQGRGRATKTKSSGGIDVAHDHHDVLGRTTECLRTKPVSDIQGARSCHGTSPFFLRVSFRSIHRSPGWQTTSESASAKQITVSRQYPLAHPGYPP